MSKTHCENTELAELFLRLQALEEWKKDTEWRLQNLEAGQGSERDADLECRISIAFKGLRVYVSRNASLADAAARVFEQLIDPYEPVSVGLSGGRTIYGMVESLRLHYKKITAYTLCCDGLHDDMFYSASAIVNLVRRLHQADCKYIGVSPELAPDLPASHTNGMNELVETFANTIEHAFTGIGVDALKNFATKFNNELDPDIVGDMLYRPLMRNGTIGTVKGLDWRIVGVTPDQLKDRLNGIEKGRLKNIVGVASGKEKAEAVLAACLGGYINYLVIDVALARELLKKHGESG